MSWSRLLEAGKVARHRTSKQELDALRAAIERNLGDAGLVGLSADNRFGLAYEAANIVTPRRASEVLGEVRQLVLSVEEWVRTHHTHLAR